MINPELARLFILLLAGYVTVMAVAWVIAWKLNFLSLVDAVWAYGIGIGSAFIQLHSGQNYFRTAVVATLALFWGLRLGSFLSVRLKRHYPIEDTRYQNLKTNWAKNLKLKTFLFFTFQGVTQSIFSIPFFMAAANNSPFPQVSEILSIMLVVSGVIGESIADWQLAHFKLNSAIQSKVCDAGLWKYSRHPNYFFEWLIWLGFGTFSIGAPQGWISLFAPALMLYLLLFVTGVRPSEEQSLKSRGDAYKLYQNKTSTFIPWFPKKQRN